MEVDVLPLVRIKQFHTISSKSFRVIWELGDPMLLSVLKREKQRLREVKCFALGHRAG